MLRSISFFLFLVLLLALPTNAQSPHPNALNVPTGIDSKFRSDPEKNLTEFVNTILKGITSDEEKIRILHDWTAVNIRYDVEGYFGNSKIVYNTFDVIKTGKSVCEGYCNVLELLLTTAGIENKKVPGYARGYGFDIFAGNEKFESNHAWTAVKLNGKWASVTRLPASTPSNRINTVRSACGRASGGMLTRVTRSSSPSRKLSNDGSGPRGRTAAISLWVTALGEGSRGAGGTSAARPAESAGACDGCTLAQGDAVMTSEYGRATSSLSPESLYVRVGALPIASGKQRRSL